MKKNTHTIWRRKKWFVLESATIFFRFFSSQSFYTRFSHVTVNSQFDWLSVCMNFLTPQRSVDKVTRTLNKHQGSFGFFRNNLVKYCSKKWINMMMCFMFYEGFQPREASRWIRNIISMQINAFWYKNHNSGLNVFQT